jgi:hypothetical protein
MSAQLRQQCRFCQRWFNVGPSGTLPAHRPRPRHLALSCPGSGQRQGIAPAVPVKP